MQDELLKSGLIGVIKDIGIFAIKSLLTLNAGAIIVLLTFVGNIDDSATVAFDIIRLKESMFAFLLGLSMVFGAITVTYFSAQQHLSNLGFSGQSFSWFIVKMVVPSALSFFAFVIGVFLAISGIDKP